MITETQYRNQIIRRIQRMPLSKLKESSKLVNEMEIKSPKKDKNLSFAGTWGNLDADFFSNLTENLIESRTNNKRRYE